jgi:hypothetical protein
VEDPSDDNEKLSKALTGTSRAGVYRADTLNILSGIVFVFLAFTVVLA